MPEDIVIDANVFMHAEDPRQGHQAQAVKLLERIRNSDIKLCVDGKFSTIRAENRSRIFAEYYDHCGHGASLTFILLGYLAQNNRITGLSRNVPNKLKRRIDILIWDPTDRIYPRIASNSKEKLFVSHDFANFPDNVRDEFSKDFDIQILDCINCLRLV